MKLKQHYDSKSQFIHDVLKLCRNIKKQYKENKLYRKQPYFYNAFVSIENEYWKFSFFVSDKVETEALFYGNNEVKYPRTIWGEKYIRWDNDLAIFLTREVLKK